MVIETDSLHAEQSHRPSHSLTQSSHSRYSSNCDIFVRLYDYYYYCYLLVKRFMHVFTPSKRHVGAYIFVLRLQFNFESIPFLFHFQYENLRVFCVCVRDLLIVEVFVSLFLLFVCLPIFTFILWLCSTCFCQIINHTVNNS